MDGKNIIRAQHYYHHKNDISNQFTKIFFVIPLLFSDAPCIVVIALLACFVLVTIIMSWGL